MTGCYCLVRLPSGRQKQICKQTTLRIARLGLIVGRNESITEVTAPLNGYATCKENVSSSLFLNEPPLRLGLVRVKAILIIIMLFVTATGKISHFIANLYQKQFIIMFCNAILA